MAVHSSPLVLLTRPRAASERFAAGLHAVEVVIAPLMEIVGTGAEVPLGGVAGLVLTSRAALDFVPMGAKGLPAYCVGPGTVRAARDAGLEAEQVGHDADSLVAGLLAKGLAGPLLHLHGQHTRGEVADRLCAGGLQARGIAVYDQRAVAPPPDFHAALARDGVLVPLFSPRSATLFAEAEGGQTHSARLFAMSEAVRGALPALLRPRCTVIAAPNGAEMARALDVAAIKPISP